MPKFRLELFPQGYNGNFANDQEALRQLSFQAKQEGLPGAKLVEVGPDGLDLQVQTTPNVPDLNKPTYVEVCNHKIEVFPRAFAERDADFEVEQLDFHNGTATFTARGAHEFCTISAQALAIDTRWAIVIAVKDVECYRDNDGDDVCDHSGFFFIDGDSHYPLPFELEQVYADEIIELLKNDYRENR